MDVGGTVGYIIIVLGAFGCALGVWRCWMLWRQHRTVERQFQIVSGSAGGSQTAMRDNPLARVIETAAAFRHSDAEMLELRLDEAMAREVPVLKRGLHILKLLGAVTPLLGLLGTVIGMMDAMHAMAAMAESERVEAMAKGISGALVTTMLGLSFAVPLILLHAAAAAVAAAIEARMEEYCARAIANRADR